MAELQDKLGMSLTTSASSSHTTLAADMVNVTMRSVAPSAAPSAAEPTPKRIPTSLSVGKLKLMCKRMYGIEPAKQAISFRRDRHGIPEAMDRDHMTLGQYGIEDGHEVLVNEL
mmetsp:Transcript_17762/g.60344  ORF Transcript_17762/g.60344 Transcript_17762/m.60344 type:complete len:114 (+) Transcript_17762:179-520(+)